MTNHKLNTSRRNFLKKAGQTTVIGTLGTSIILNTKKSYAASKDKIRIGIPLPLTGMFSGDGQEFRRGIIMAIKFKRLVLDKIFIYLPLILLLCSLLSFL